MRLRFDNDLVSGIHRGHAGIALQYALGGGHLGRLIVGAVALADRATGSLAIGVARQLRAQLLWLTLQALQALRVLGLQIRFNRLVVLIAMSLQHHRGRRLELVELLLEVRTRAAARLGRVAGSFTPSIANISWPISPWLRQINGNAAKT